MGQILEFPDPVSMSSSAGARPLAAQLERMRGMGLHSAQAGCETFNTAAIAYFRKQGWYVRENTREPPGEGVSNGIIVFGYAL